MGVGKTVQILTFLAWCIESGKFPGLSESEPPFQPILIVAPLILVDTRTWEKEMEKFFANEGVIFWPVLSLRGDQLAKLRLDDVAGREIEIGTPILDLNRIQRHKVVITNYETIKSYQHSFAFVKDGTPLWSSRSSVRSPREALHSRLCGGAGSLALTLLRPNSLVTGKNNREF